MSFNVCDKSIGNGHAPFIILEAGINHNGEIQNAEQMIKAAKNIGADAIKFQTFKASEFIADTSQQFTYRSQGKEITESMLKMFQRYEFSKDAWFQIKKMCDDTGIIFMSTPQNESDLNLLLDIGVPALKVGSDDFTNLPLLEKYSSTGLPLFMSCGMADLGEVHDAIIATDALARNDVLLMLCTSQYPTPAEDVNISKLKTLAAAFPNLPLGFSDHTQGDTAAILATAMGAIAFEKHFTLSHDLPGPDHWFSETPDTASSWVASLRSAHQMIGSGSIIPTTKEIEMRKLARRSVTALCDIEAGDIFTNDNLGLMRPGSGLPPKMINHFIGQKSRTNIKISQQMKFSDIA